MRNRYLINQQLDGVRASLKEAVNKVEALYADSKSTIEDRREAENVVRDLKERAAKYENDIREMDEEANRQLQNKKDVQGMSEKDKKIASKANVIRGMIKKESVADDLKALGGSYFLNALSTATTGQGGAAILPKTTASEAIVEPKKVNKLRDYVRISHESNLEIPKLTFSIADDAFIEDEATAKELKVNGSTVTFGRFKSKVFCDVSETMLLGTDINLVSEVEAGLDSAIQTKEKKQLFGTDLGTTEKHMSFYEKDGPNYTIHEIGRAHV